MLTPFCNNPNATILGDIMLIGNWAVMTKKNTWLLYSYITIWGPRNITVRYNNV